MVTLNGKVALVTGASSGIGEGIAKMLAAEGARVALVARRQEELECVAEAIRQRGGTALVAAADMRDETALRGSLERVQHEFGPVDILVNNAGTVYTTPVHAIDMQDWDAALGVNLRAPVLLCAAVLPGMRARQHGFIVNIASEAGLYVYAGMGAYAISKHALRVLTELIQQENQELGIKAWAICPGYVNTSMGVAFGGAGANPDHFLTVDEVVDVVRFLLSQGANVKMGPEILIRTTLSPMREDEEK